MEILGSLLGDELLGALTRSPLILAAIGTLALTVILLVLKSLVQDSFGLFLMALMIGLATAWILSWIGGWQESLTAYERLGGWVASGLILAIMTIVVARNMSIAIALPVALVPIVLVLAIADIAAGRSLEWRLLGADRATIARGLALPSWLELNGESATGSAARPTWSDVAEAWRSYSEETRKLDAAVDNAASDNNPNNPEGDQ